MRASTWSRVAWPPELFVNTQLGVWRCQTSAWPRTFMLFVCANETIRSAVVYVKLFSVGSSASNFISFSAVTLLKCLVRTDACVVYELLSTAAPIGKKLAYFWYRLGATVPPYPPDPLWPPRPPAPPPVPADPPWPPRPALPAPPPLPATAPPRPPVLPPLPATVPPLPD